MRYQEYPPHPALSAFVACTWSACSVGGGAAHRVLPDNCVDILWQDQGSAGFAVGMMSRAIRVASPLPVRTVAVRFKPGAAGLFLGLPLHELNDQRADIDLLWERGAAARLTDALWARALSDRERIHLIEQHLLAQLRKLSPSAMGTLIVRRALAAIDGSDGALRVDALAQQLGVSRQHLAAQFRVQVGLTPKLYARISRFRRATAMLTDEAARTGAAPDWAQLALDCGYFDQSHLIHDFQEFAGSTPQRFALA
ncbi:AraC family transcriptional regulator [Oxalobacteraceae bacterium]|nr:AraC family transcriptional regulator [Oxalobacteraceae bacterium]